MNKPVYEGIVKNILLPLSNELLESENNKLYDAIKIKKKFDDKLLDKINELICFVKGNLVISHEIDRHKISACLMCAVEIYSPFSISKKGYNCEDLFFANELLAIYSAISLLECYNPELKIVFPNTQYRARDINPFVKTFCESLYISKNNKKLKYSILIFSENLFWLEYSSLLKNNTQ